jgi:signal transduction histidine kinase
VRYILMSLVENAIKFTEEGEMRISAETEDDWIIVRVKDTGPGISEDDTAVLFEPFQHQRGSTAESGKGTGLGLPVSRLLALMHGGDLTVDSVLHQGSTFTLLLPCHVEGAPPRPEPEANE